MVPFKDITPNFLDRVQSVNYTDLPRLKICPTILDYVTEDIVYHLKSSRPYNYIRERINKHILWDLSNKRIEGDRAINVKFLGQSIWTREALLRYLERKGEPGISNIKGLQLEHCNERIWYTNRLQAMSPEAPGLKGRVKSLLETTLCVVVTPELHRRLPSGETLLEDPWRRYREEDPTLYWIDWNRAGRWSIERIQKIII